MFTRLTFVLLLLSSIGAIAAQNDPLLTVTCPGALPSRLVPGEAARVMPGDANRVRRLPSTDAEVVGAVPGDAVFTAISGPACVDGYAWWYISYEDFFGWTVEGSEDYWLEPVTDAALDPLGSPANHFFRYGGIRAEILVANTSSLTLVPGDPANALPPHGQIVFSGYQGPQNHGDLSATVNIYDAKQYETISETSLDPLREKVEAVRSSPGTIDVDTADLFVPRVNAAPIFTARAQATCFNPSCGITYLAYFAQDSHLLTDGELVFVYTGLTNDDRYYIEALFFLDSLLLPDQDFASSETFDTATFTADYYADYVKALPALFEGHQELTYLTRPLLHLLLLTVHSIDIDSAVFDPTETAQPVTFEGISFDLPPLLAETTTPLLEPAVTDATFSWDERPPQIRFAFEGYEEWYGIFVYSVVDYEAMFADSLNMLRQTLDNPPEVPPVAGGPRINAALPMTAQVDYLDFANGSGVRYVGFWTQDYNTITPNSLRYVYVGLTNDRQYYVLVVLPVTNYLVYVDPRVEDYKVMDFSAAGNNYQDYMAVAEDILNASSSVAFVPTLDEMDGMVRSLHVQADVLLEMDE